MYTCRTRRTRLRARISDHVEATPPPTPLRVRDARLQACSRAGKPVNARRASRTLWRSALLARSRAARLCARYCAAAATALRTGDILRPDATDPRGACEVFFTLHAVLLEQSRMHGAAPWPRIRRLTRRRFCRSTTGIWRHASGSTGGSPLRASPSGPLHDLAPLLEGSCVNPATGRAALSLEDAALPSRFAAGH